MIARVSIIKCSNYDSDAVVSSVKKAVDLSGGIEKFIKPGSKVLIKPNLLMAKDPNDGITTHPEIVRGVVRLLKQINCRLYLGDGPSVWGNQIENVDDVYEYTGMSKLCREEGVELVKFEKKVWKRMIPLTEWVEFCDHVVNIPKFKTHSFTLLSGAIKNLFGLVPGIHKTTIHKNHFEIEDFSRVLVDIYEIVKPSLTVVDAIRVIEGDGPATSGRARDLGLIMASSDCVALDSIMSLIMGVKPYHVLTTKEASHRDLGNPLVGSMSISGEELGDIVPESFLLPSSSLKSRIPLGILRMIRNFIKYYPVSSFTKCIKCGACIKACPKKCISAKGERLAFNYRDCIGCFCCQEVCPVAAIEIKRSALAKLVGL